MKVTRYQCEILTPMFIYGADQNTPELRATAIKASMRYWWRAVNTHLGTAKLKEEEIKIFGGLGSTSDAKAQAGIFKLRVTEKPKKTVKERPVRTKNFRKTAFAPGSVFEVEFAFTNATVEKKQDMIQKVELIFELASILGGLGTRTRRGMGAYAITGKWSSIDPDNPLPFLSREERVSLTRERNLSPMIENRIKAIRLEGESQIMEAGIRKKPQSYFIPDDISVDECLEEIGESAHQSRYSGSDIYSINLFRGVNAGEMISRGLGDIRPRMTSAVYVSFYKVLKQDYMIFTMLEPYKSNDVVYRVQEDFVEDILYHTVK